MKQQVARSEDHCSEAIPIIEWPEVHPPAYRVPNPTKNPPIIINISPWTEKIRSRLKISNGSKPLRSWMPSSPKVLCVSLLIAAASPPFKKRTAKKAPSIIPAAKKRFQLLAFQLYLKNEISAGKQAAQICRSVDEIPKTLLPAMSRSGTISPIRGPAIYQGHGCFINSSITFDLK